MAGNFEMLNCIGSGTFGEAWLARNKKDNTKCVLKVIKILRLSDKELDQALTEVSVLARCKHVNIIKYLNAFVNDGALSIVMEYADGGDLHKRIVSQKGIHFGKEVILDWFVQICFALKYLNLQNILHRDLKTQNIFLTLQNVVKLGDFGIARVLRDSADCALTTIGTPFYLSPEICQKKPYNHKSDMWALGCVLYEMCTLHVPFNAKDFDSLVMKIMTGQFEPLPSHFGTTIRYLCTRLLDQDPSKRLSANEVLNFSPLKTFVQRYEAAKRRAPQLSVRKYSGNTEDKLVRRKSSGFEGKKDLEKGNKKSKEAVLKENSDQCIRNCSDPVDKVHDKEMFARRPSIRAECASSGKKGIDWISDKENIDPRRLIGNKTYQVKYPKFRRFSLATPRIKRIVSQQRSSLSSQEQEKCKKMNDECVRTVLYRNIERGNKKSSSRASNSKEQENVAVNDSMDEDDVFGDASIIPESFEEFQKTQIEIKCKVDNNKRASIESRRVSIESRRSSMENTRRASVESRRASIENSRRASIENSRRPSVENSRKSSIENLSTVKENVRRCSIENCKRPESKPRSLVKLRRKPTVDKNYRKVSGSDGCLYVPNVNQDVRKSIRRSSSYDAITNDQIKSEEVKTASGQGGSETYLVNKPQIGSVRTGACSKDTISGDNEMMKYINKALYMSLQDFLQSPGTAKNKTLQRLHDIFGDGKLEDILEVCRECLYNHDNYDTFYSLLSDTDILCLPLIFQYLQLEGSQ